jgi:lipopolysaccharide/colanic/teichoic acid biosynthesis glycosyltransferase
LKVSFPPLGFKETSDSWHPLVLRRRIETRIFDVAAAAAILVFFTPLMVLIAAAIFAEGGRPIFFSQIRLGRYGQYFHMYKFRKFHHRGGSAGLALTVEDDPRLTGVGRFLAVTKLDELPQFWNVFKGDMSIVGPRPESRDFEDCFDGPSRLVLQHKPGIFGPSQVVFRNEGCLYRNQADPERFYREIIFPLKARIDLAYFAHRSFFLDIAWAIWSALAVFRWPVSRRVGALLVEQAEQGARDGRGADDWGLPARIGLPSGLGRLCGSEIVRKDEAMFSLSQVPSRARKWRVIPRPGRARPSLGRTASNS